MKSNIVENNNSFAEFNQTWSKYIFTDDIPDTPPKLRKAYKHSTKTNIDNESQYTVHVFQKTEHETTYDYLIYISNFQLTKEFRQGKSWKLELGGDEESLRNLILPTMTTSREYTPTFTDGEYEIPFTSVDPNFDFKDCRIDVGLDFDRLYFSGWLYVGKNLRELLVKYLPPFDDELYLLKNKDTSNKASFHVGAEKRYKLPGDTFEDVEKSDTIITSTILNQALDSFGVLDEGEFW